MKRRPLRVGCRKRKGRRRGQDLRLEQLERRDLMTATPFDPMAGLSGTMCNCPICSGQSLDQLVGNTGSTGGAAAGAPVAATYPLGNLPSLSSNPNATATLVLDFNGNTLSAWGTKTNVVTPVYDIDGDASTFSDQELANIREIWARVSEDYAPFNINVTTVDPGVLTDKVVAKIAIGGSASDWYGASAGGVAYIGGFYNTASNVGFVFENNLGNGNARYVAEAASHEAGHLFGLSHQSKWNGTTRVAEYNQGDANWAPIMGVGYYSAVTTWTYGAKPIGYDVFQDDMAVIAHANNGFGYRVNSIGSASTAGNLGTTGTVSASGIIAQNTDLQWWRFTTGGGSVSLNVNTIGVGANLDSVLEIRDSSGNVLYTANSSATLNSSLTANLNAGTYYAVVRSTGVYGYVGQYTLTGSFTPVSAPPTSEPEITVLQGVTNIADGGSSSFGTTTVGTSVDRTFTIRNDGTAVLTLQTISASNFPAGFSIVSNIGSTTLQVGQTTTFTIRLTAATAGTFSGVVRFNSNDANEGTYDINVSGTVTAPPAPEVTLLLGATGVADGGSVSFGSTNVGTFVDRTFTIRNDGNAALTLQTISASNLPAGFSIVSNIGSTTLQAGQTTTFTIRMTAATAGSFSGVIRFNTNDSDEAIYDINVSGTVTTPPAPEVTVLVGATGVADGGSVSFGSTLVGTFVDRTFTIRNDGDAALTLQTINTSTLPAGFSLVSNIGSTTLQAGQTTTFTVRMTAATAGSFSGVIRFSSNDADEAIYDINVSGTVTTPPAPEVTVLLGATGVADGGSVSFGSTLVGTFVDRTFTIRNDGDAALTLQTINTATLPAGFSIVSNIGSTTLQAGQTTTFTIRMTAATAGSFAGVIRFDSNDADEATYDLDISGTVSPPPAPEVTVLLGATGVTDGGSVSFGSTTVGTFVDRTFTIRNDGDAALTLQTINTANLPAGFSIVSNIGSTTLQAGQTTTFTVRMTAATAGSFSGVIRFGSNDADEAIYDINVSGTVTTPPAPEVTVLLGATGVTDGGSVAFGSTTVGTFVDKTFTIRNDGNATLALQTINTANLPAGFSIVSNIGSTTLLAGETTTFTVRMTAATAGSFSGVVRFSSNDADEAIYDINVSGTVTTPPAPEVTVLLGATGVADGGSVSFGTTVVGTFVDKTFTIRNDGNATLTLQAINTSTLPAGFSIVSNIGSTTLLAGETTTFTVRMTAAAAGSFSGVIRFANNDANEAIYDINLSGTVSPAPAPEVTVLLGGNSIAGGGAVSFGRTNVGTFVDKTFTIRNDGDLALTLQAIDTSNLPVGFSIVSNIGATTLQSGETTTFTVRMIATAAGNFSGVIRFVSNDADESTFDITVLGEVAAPVTQLVTLRTVDNGDAGYLGGGTWATNVGAGYSNDFSFAQPTGGVSFARWTAIDLAPGTYRISVSYLAFAKAASNARFYFGDDVATLGSKLINQRLQPAGFPAEGVWWQRVGNVTITAGHEQLWVQATNRGTNGFVVADGVRFERIATPAPSLPASSAPLETALVQYLADDVMAQWNRRR